jgi:hypothetical protein
MRKEVNELIKLGPMPDEEAVEVETVEKYERLLHQIKPPLSNHEAESLIILFGSDSFFGLAWTLVNLIETAPGWPSHVSIPNSENEWVQLLIKRATSY